MASPNPNANVATPVPFPHPDSESQPNASTNSPTPPTSPQRRPRTSTNTSIASATRSIRTASIKLMDVDLPPGMWAATGSAASKAPTLAEIRRGSFGSTGWNEESQRYKAERRASQGDDVGKSPRRKSSADPATPVRPGMGKYSKSGSSGALRELTSAEPFPAVTEEEMGSIPARETNATQNVYEMPKYDGKDKDFGAGTYPKESSEATETTGGIKLHHEQPQRQYSNGYVPPPKVPWKISFVIGLKAFWKWFLTVPGFLITVYGLNVVAWGGMLFLLLCNAAPAMCKPTCNDIQSPRRIWIEIDSQILNALFCVTGFGLAPWRFRDLYFWGKWRLGGSKNKEVGIRRLAGIHRGWFRLPGSDALPPLASVSDTSPEDPAVPIPHEKIPDAPPTGIHAPPTKGWKMDFVVWMNMWNTLFQIVLCFYMWHYNRYDRPSWATGLFVALGCIVAGVGGLMMYHEGKYVKKVEGVPVPKGYENQMGDIEAPSTQPESVPLVADPGPDKAAQA